MRIYDRVKEIMSKFPETRDNDELLAWEFHKREGKVAVKVDFGTQSVLETMSKEQFLSAVSNYDIVRNRQEIERIHPELRGKTYDKRHARVNEVVYTKEI